MPKDEKSIKNEYTNTADELWPSFKNIITECIKVTQTEDILRMTEEKKLLLSLSQKNVKITCIKNWANKRKVRQSN